MWKALLAYFGTFVALGAISLTGVDFDPLVLGAAFLSLPVWLHLFSDDEGH